MRTPIISLATLVLLNLGVAHAAPVTPSSVQALLSLMADGDVTKTLESGTSVEFTYARSGINQTTRLFNCTDNTSCTGVMTYATFSLGSAAIIDDYMDVNLYNDSYPYGRAFIISPETDDAAMGVDYVVDVSGADNFEAQHIEFFTNTILKDFFALYDY